MSPAASAGKSTIAPTVQTFVEATDTATASSATVSGASLNFG